MSSLIKIKKITKVHTDIPVKVYDIEMPKNSNFVLGNNLVVHNCKPYQFLKSTLTERRILMYKSDRLYDEFVNVERNLNTGKIDHTPNYHKDVLDAVCGATFTASKYAGEYAFNYGENLNAFLEANIAGDESYKQQQLVEDFTNELAKVSLGTREIGEIKVIPDNTGNNIWNSLDYLFEDDSDIIII